LIPLILYSFAVEFYRKKLEAARNVTITILFEGTEKSVEVGGEFDRMQREAEQLAVPLGESCLLIEESRC
jgi:hypothetical protein